MSITSMFFLLFLQKEQVVDFLFLSWRIKVLPKWGLLLKERFCSQKQIFSSIQNLTPTEKGGKNGHSRVAPTKVYPFNLRAVYTKVTKYVLQGLYSVILTVKHCKINMSYQNFSTGETMCFRLKFGKNRIITAV